MPILRRPVGGEMGVGEGSPNWAISGVLPTRSYPRKRGDEDEEGRVGGGGGRRKWGVRK